MWSKMLLLSLHILFLLTLANSDDRIIFSNISTPARKNYNNETGTTSTTVQPLQPLQSQQLIPINNTVKTEVNNIIVKLCLMVFYKKKFGQYDFRH